MSENILDGPVNRSILLNFLVFSFPGYSLAFSVDDMARLEDDLLTGYKVSTRPASQTNVTVSMLLANVLELVRFDSIALASK